MQLYVLTGEVMCGKTSWLECMLLAAGLPIETDNPAVASIKPATDARLDIAGIYTPGVFAGEEKLGIDATLLPECKRFSFAKRRAGFDGDERAAQRRANESGGIPKKLGWEFSDAAIERINAHLASCESCDLLVIDELGILELVRGGGFTQGMRLLDEGLVDAALVVIRESLLPYAQERWGDFERVTPETDIDRFLARFK